MQHEVALVGKGLWWEVVFARTGHLTRVGGRVPGGFLCPGESE